MILATVGTQLPFPRLLRALDRIAAARGLTVVAQTCGNLPDPVPIEQHAFLPPATFADLVVQADVLVGHAGIGTIFAGLRAAKPLILFPRQATLGEHRNDHQLATAKAMADRPGIHVAWSEEDLERLLMAKDLAAPLDDHAPERPRLIATVAAFIEAA